LIVYFEQGEKKIVDDVTVQLEDGALLFAAFFVVEGAETVSVSWLFISRLKLNVPRSLRAALAETLESIIALEHGHCLGRHLEWRRDIGR
jgi:uncharacterized membrane protein YccC